MMDTFFSLAITITWKWILCICYFCHCLLSATVLQRCIQPVESSSYTWVPAARKLTKPVLWFLPWGGVGKVLDSQQVRQMSSIPLRALEEEWDPLKTWLIPVSILKCFFFLSQMNGKVFFFFSFFPFICKFGARTQKNTCKAQHLHCDFFLSNIPHPVIYLSFKGWIIEYKCWKANYSEVVSS